MHFYFLPIPEVGIDGDEETTEGPTTEVVTFIDEIPTVTGLFGNEGGVGFGGGPPVVAAKLFPEIIPIIIYFNYVRQQLCDKNV